MKRQDATEIATEVCQLWPKGLNASVWEEVLQDDYSDAERARIAVQKMKRIIHYAPSISHFHEQYLLSPSSFDVGEPTVCTDCLNDGWHFAPSYLRNSTEYTAVKPCAHCKHGRKAEHSAIWKERQLLKPFTPTTETDQKENAA